jgi:hypothetical protein
MNRELNQPDSKKPYETPQLTTISLRPEEAVLGHCKSFNAGGSVQSTCTFISVCHSVGS